MEGIVTCKRVETAQELSQALDIRRRVFVEEQQIPAEREQDGRNPEAFHVLALIENQPIATGRLVIPSEAEGILARIAVLPLYRRQGIGTKIVEELEKLAYDAGVRHLVMTPHDYLESFYHRLGYHKIPGEKQVAAHRVITMEKFLSDI